MVHEVLLNHSCEAMAQLGVGEVGVEFEAWQGKSIIANEGREDALDGQLSVLKGQNEVFRPAYRE